MKFAPKSEQEVAESGLLAAGEYPFEVIEADERQSKAGNDMIALKVKVHADDTAYGIFDYLVANVAYKVRHFADAVGLLAEYEAGTLDAESLPGLTGKCKVAIQPAKDGYDAKNVVKDYIKRSANEPVQKRAAVATADMDDEIPF